MGIKILVLGDKILPGSEDSLRKCIWRCLKANGYSVVKFVSSITNSAYHSGCSVNVPGKKLLLITDHNPTLAIFSLIRNGNTLDLMKKSKASKTKLESNVMPKPSL